MSRLQTEGGNGCLGERSRERRPERQMARQPPCFTLQAPRLSCGALRVPPPGLPEAPRVFTCYQCSGRLVDFPSPGLSLPTYQVPN